MPRRGGRSGAVGVAAALSRKPDLVICDIGMPGLNGFGVLARLRAEPATAGTPFVFLTASADVRDESTGYKLGANEYVIKPFDTAVLTSLVRQKLWPERWRGDRPRNTPPSFPPYLGQEDPDHRGRGGHPRQPAPLSRPGGLRGGGRGQRRPRPEACPRRTPGPDPVRRHDAGDEWLRGARGVAAVAPLAQVPFIFLTASADRDSIAKGISLGAADYVTKPFDLLQLAELIRRRLGEAD